MTQPTDTETIWVTQQAYDRLQQELEHLKGDVRADITAKIAAAREEQGKTEARIRQLEEMLRRAEVGEKPADDGLVEAGMKVTIRFAGDTDTETFLLGSRELLSMDSAVDLDVYSPTSPLGAAIVDKKVGDTASYQAPTGSTITVEIVDAVPF